MSLVNIDTKRNNKVLNSLKVAHKKFTWSGKEIPHIGSYGGHKWHGFWLKDLDAREAFPLSTKFRLARLYKQTRTINRYTKTYMTTYCKDYKTPHCFPC